ncbi:MAG: TIM barrel protein [Anaerolineae bacterium]|nr:TIM barrel protein [Anaerolineae bacterium]
MRIGLGSYAFRWAIGAPGARPAAPLDPPALIDRAAALGAEVLQICDNLPLDGLSDRALAALAGRASAHGLALQLGIQGSDPAHLRRSLAVAAQIEARVLRVVLSTDERTPDMDESAVVLRALLPDLRAAEVTLAIENHFDRSPAALARLVQAIDDPLVRVCLDPLNAIARLSGAMETARVLAPYAVVVHVKDAVARRAGTGFAIVGCPLGEGLVDVAGVLAVIRSAGQDPDLLVESWMDRLADEASTLAQEEAWVQDGIAYLRRVRDEA